MRLLKTALVVGLLFQTAPAEAQSVPAPTVPPDVACNHEGCIFGTPEGVIHDGYKYSQSVAPGTGSVGWWEHVSYMPPGTVFRVRLCNGPAPFATENCGPAAEVVTPQPPRPTSVRDIIYHHFGRAGGAAVAVATCESGLDPGARSPGGGNNGLFQINTVHRSTFQQVTGQAYWNGVFDAWANTLFAKWLYNQQGWEPWTCKP